MDEYSDTTAVRRVIARQRCKEFRNGLVVMNLVGRSSDLPGTNTVRSRGSAMHDSK